MSPRLLDPWRWPHAAALLAAALSAALYACDAAPLCYRGEYRSCTCPGACPARGYQRCSDDGADYGACDCISVIPGLTASSSGDAGNECDAGGLDGAGGSGGGAGGSGGDSGGAGGAGGQAP